MKSAFLRIALLKAGLNVGFVGAVFSFLAARALVLASVGLSSVIAHSVKLARTADRGEDGDGRYRTRHCPPGLRAGDAADCNRAGRRLTAWVWTRILRAGLVGVAPGVTRSHVSLLHRRADCNWRLGALGCAIPARRALVSIRW